MTGEPSWQLFASIAGSMSALVGVPLTVVILYLRAIREDQRSTHALWQRRVDQMESNLRRVESALDGVQRAYTTKDEWLRETMLARQHLERLSEQLARLQADMENARGLATQFGRATHAIIQLADHLAGRTAGR